jgi:hypothetical protein
MEQLQQWRRQRDLLMLAETSQQERLNLTVRTEITKLLKLNRRVRRPRSKR